MKHLRDTLRYFLPMEGDGDGDRLPGTGDGTGGGDGKPDWCEEKFYDADAGVRTQVLHESYTELQGKFSAGKSAYEEEVASERLANTPEKYEIVIPDDLKVPEGVEITLKEDDPMASWFMGWAKENGLSQEAFESAVSGYIKNEVANLPSMTDEIAKLGDYGQDRIQRVNTWLEKSLSGEQFKSLSGLLTSADQVAALEVLMKGHTPGQFEGDSQTSALTLEELQNMQKDPRAWRDYDKVYLKKIADGYNRLFPQ